MITADDPRIIGIAAAEGRTPEAVLADIKAVVIPIADELYDNLVSIGALVPRRDDGLAC